MHQQIKRVAAQKQKKNVFIDFPYIEWDEWTIKSGQKCPPEHFILFVIKCTVKNSK